MAAGAQATRQGWRWSYRTMGIFNAVLFVLFIVFYEESKYIPTIEGVTPAARPAQQIPPDETGNKAPLKHATRVQQRRASSPPLDHNIPMKTWGERLSLVTYTPEPIWPYFYRPIEILFTFPAVLCCGLQYACGVIWLTILSSVIALVFPLPPYEFTPEQIGYMSVGPFVGNLIGSFYGGFLGDWSIKYFSRQNSGYYEPEMRLYILHLPAVALCGGLVMFGVTIDKITGDAFTGVAFLRNAFSIGIPFAISPWMEHSGLTKMFVTCGFISLGVTVTLLGMAIYGKRFRSATAKRYRKMSGMGG
ncbi:hypothetical protein APSETT445_009039 [Aspergillus pseudonomiae]